MRIMFPLTKYCLRPATIFLLCCTLLCQLLFCRELEYAARVVRVVDGDTVQITVHGTSKHEKLRFYGIDAPESKQAFGTESRQALSKLVNGRLVRVKEQNRDRYGRIVGRVFYDGEDVGLEMIRLGMAWHYPQYCKDASYKAAHDLARSRKVGLWYENKPVAPWEFRSKKRSKSAK